MKRLSLLLLCILLSLPTSTLMANIKVLGTVWNRNTHQPIPFDGGLSQVDVYVVRNKELANRVKEIIDRKDGTKIDPAILLNKESCDEEGLFRIENTVGEYSNGIPEDSYLIIYVMGSKDGSVIVPVDGRQRIPTIEVDFQQDRQLSNVDISAGIQEDSVMVESVPTCIKGKLKIENTYRVSRWMGQSNARLLYQPYVIKCSNDSVVGYRTPKVFQGEEYTRAMKRYYSFNPKKYDPLYPYIDSTIVLSEEPFSFKIKDSLSFGEKDTSLYQYKAIQRIVDYKDVIHDSVVTICTCECVDPFRFLEINLPIKQLNIRDYYEKPRAEQFFDKSEVRLIFKRGEAVLDPEVKSNITEMAKLNKDLNYVISSADAKLDSLFLEGVSSPEGIYASNLELSDRRAKYVLATILKPLSDAQRKTITSKSKGIVAPWEDVAKILRDSLPYSGLGEKVQDIINRHPKDPDTQYQEIRQMSEYSSTIEPYLPLLRKVTCTITKSVFRNYSRKEIVDKFYGDSLYRMEVQKPLYEYWHLFQGIEDKNDLMEVCQAAYQTPYKGTGKPWILAANIYASLILDMGGFDVSILDTLLNKSKGVDKGVTKREINPSPVVANQINMLLRDGQYEQAEKWAMKLPLDAEFNIYRAYTKCLLGHYKSPKDSTNVRLVSETSPRNAVVMALAMQTPAMDSYADQLCMELDQEIGETWYLKAIINMRRSKRSNFDYDDVVNTEDCLIRALELAPELIDILMKDGEFYVPENSPENPRASAKRQFVRANANKKTEQ